MTTEFKIGDAVRKKGDKGQWHGFIVGTYSTKCTPNGYAVESVYEENSVQIYPASALEPWSRPTPESEGIAGRGDKAVENEKIKKRLMEKPVQFWANGNLMADEVRVIKESLATEPALTRLQEIDVEAIKIAAKDAVYGSQDEFLDALTPDAIIDCTIDHLASSGFLSGGSELEKHPPMGYSREKELMAVIADFARLDYIPTMGEQSDLCMELCKKHAAIIAEAQKDKQ